MVTLNQWFLAPRWRCIRSADCQLSIFLLLVQYSIALSTSCETNQFGNYNNLRTSEIQTFIWSSLEALLSTKFTAYLCFLLWAIFSSIALSPIDAIIKSSEQFSISLLRFVNRKRWFHCVIRIYEQKIYIFKFMYLIFRIEHNRRTFGVRLEAESML